MNATMNAVWFFNWSGGRFCVVRGGQKHSLSAALGAGPEKAGNKPLRKNFKSLAEAQQAIVDQKTTFEEWDTKMEVKVARAEMRTSSNWQVLETTLLDGFGGRTETPGGKYRQQSSKEIPAIPDDNPINPIFGSGCP